ncbi:MAG: hypothetical protein HY898_05510 [Deltaproteobacteria bacterium]|nr:hypothetical protein [Deltaproteobacteria bacterium]
MTFSSFTRLFAAFGIMLAMACGASSTTPSTPNDAATDADRPQVPDALRSFESNAEGCGEAARAGDWTKAQGILDQANANWAKVKPDVQARGASAATVKIIDDALSALATSVPGKLSREAQTQSNSISETVPDFFDLYTFAVPSDALRLDAAFRHTQIDGEFSDWPACSTDLANVNTIWKRLKPAVDQKAPTRTDVPGAQTVAGDIDATFAKAQTAIGAANSLDTVNASQTGLDLVDVVEQIFE